MRWVKHLTMAHDDPAVDALLERHGAGGYGAFWLIVEHVASVIDASNTAAEATHSARKWAQIMRSDPRVAAKILQTLSAHLVELANTDDGRIRISVPKILKYKDEYSKKSGHSPDKLRTQSESESESEREHIGAESSDDAADAYVNDVLALYASTGATPTKADARCAKDWFSRGITPKTVEHAILLALRNRLTNEQNLPPIRSLKYYGSMLTQAANSGVEEAYWLHLKNKLTERGRLLRGELPSNDDSSYDVNAEYERMRQEVLSRRGSTKQDIADLEFARRVMKEVAEREAS